MRSKEGRSPLPLTSSQRHPGSPPLNVIPANPTHNVIPAEAGTQVTPHHDERLRLSPGPIRGQFRDLSGLAIE